MPLQHTRPKLAFGLIALHLLVASCSSNEPQSQTQNIAQIRNQENEDMVERGSYLVTAGGCFDCHTPKKMMPEGPVDDSSKTLAGHLAGTPLPPIDEKALKPGNWVLLSPDLTAFVGPWGISYPANLTPDSATGIGAWTEDVFIRTMRTGKHLGHPNGRPILPPMPWFNLAKLKEEDLQAIYAYLRSLPPINNRVPAPLSPQETLALAQGSKSRMVAQKTQ
jgi:mono/diheme cytochrome c family protein